MTTMMWIFLWFVSGWASFVWWWIKDYDFRLQELPVMIFSGIPGPISFLIGLIIHCSKGTGSRNRIVLIKKR